MYKAVLLPPPKGSKPGIPSKANAAHAAASATLAIENPEMCMRPGDLQAKDGDVFAIKKFKPDKEGDVQTYAGISQSGAREIMVRERFAFDLIAEVDVRDVG